jgi:hypothetical protein
MCSSESKLTTSDNKVCFNSIFIIHFQLVFYQNVEDIDQSSRHSSHSNTTTNTDDDQYELVRRFPSNDNHQTVTYTKQISSPEMLSSATSLSTPSSSSSDEDDEKVQTITTTTPDEKKSIIDDSNLVK